MRAGEVIIYVEGPSDQAAMQALLKPLLQKKSQEGLSISFSRALRGDRKKYILLEVPRRAVGIIISKPHTIVVAMPDLYPRNKGFKHETFDELKTGILRNFSNALRKKGAANDPRFRERLRVFCFKHDLEALVLASQEALRKHFGLDRLKVTWRIPVEDQDHNNPPRHIVERLLKNMARLTRIQITRPSYWEQATIRILQKNVLNASSRLSSSYPVLNQ